MVTIKKPNECKNCIWFNHHGKGCHNYNCHNQSEYDEYNGEKLTDNDLYERLFNPKITNGDIIRLKNNEKLALFLINITHLSPTWNYQNMLSWLNEEYIANKEITNEK